MIKCRCDSDKLYADCCKQVIETESAPTALALMRSRFTAYALKKVDYIYNTSHSITRRESSKTEIEKWANENHWTNLEIIRTERGSENDLKGIVEFKAHFIDEKGNPQIHHEKSNFIKEDGIWFYVDGILNLKHPVSVKNISRNAPCICGSGKKYKNCCG